LAESVCFSMVQQGTYWWGLWFQLQ
jgi:hypothetical protein